MIKVKDSNGEATREIMSPLSNKRGASIEGNGEGVLTGQIVEERCEG